MADDIKPRGGADTSEAFHTSHMVDPKMAETKVRWEWTFGPQTLIGLGNFIVIILGVISYWFQTRADIDAAKNTVIDLKAAVVQLVNAQTNMVERMTKVETKVDIMLPLIQRTNEQTFAPPSANGNNHR